MRALIANLGAVRKGGPGWAACTTAAILQALSCTAVAAASDSARPVWTLNQGDGSLTRIDIRTRQAIQTTLLGTPGHGGDISFGGGMLWTTVAKVPLTVVDADTGLVLCRWTGPGGDSLGIGHDAIWLTNYEAGTIARIEIHDALSHCKGHP